MSNLSNAIRITVNTPGWEHIRKMMESCVEQAKLAALINTDRNKVIELWDRAQVADQLVNSLLQDIEKLLEN